MSSSNCCFLTCIQISQEAGQVVWHSHLMKNFPVYCDPHSQRLSCSQWSKSRCFSGTLLLFWWSSGFWQFDIWFLCLFYNQHEHLEVHGLHTVEAWLGEFWALLFQCVRQVQLCGSLSILWHCLFGIGMKTDLFQSCGHYWVFQICWHIECSTFTASSFRIWNISAGIPSPPLALFIVMLPKAHLI